MAGDTSPDGAMAGLNPKAGTAENYRRFGPAARDRSPAYGQLAESVAASPEILTFLDALPVMKRQPNLLFAAARYMLGTPADPDSLRRLVSQQPDKLAAVMRERRTQTNEPARCATLLPALAGLTEPLALLEVGASAGLTLLPDFYSYDFGGPVLEGADPEAPTLPCQPHGPVPIPDRLPSIVWRAGIDLNPLDPANADDARWLECLLWPGERDREARLRAALGTARRHPVPVHQGDLVDDLYRVASGAPEEATLVIYHSAVLSYVDVESRRAFAAAVRDLGAVWLSNEAPGVLPGFTDPAAGSADSFVLIRDGRDPLASTDSHGAWITWREAAH